MRTALSQIVALWLTVMSTVLLRADEYHFADRLESCAVGSRYQDANTQVQVLADHGGNPTIQTSIGNFKAEGSKRLLSITSGEYNQYTTFGAGLKSDKRYGQLFFRVGKSSQGANWVVLSLYDENNVAGPVVWMDPNGLYRYWDKGGEVTGGKKYATDAFEEITIAYNAKEKTYDVWIGKEKLVSAATFQNKEKFGTPAKMVIGGAYWSSGPTAALDQWHWKVAADKPFATCAQALTEQPKVANFAMTAASESAASTFFINLGDYAKGDGTDETEAIQRAFDAIPPRDFKEDVTSNHPGGILFVPRPKAFYGITKTIHIVERWNTEIRCETPVWGSRGMPVNYYFRWIGPDNGTMFEFRSCKGMVVENLSMTGMDAACWEEPMKTYNLQPIGRMTKGITGIRIGPETQAGFQTSMIFDQLRVADVDTAVRLGIYADNGPDVRELSFRLAVLGPFSSYGVIAASGNLANVTFETVSTAGGKGAKAAFRLDGGEMLLLNWNGTGGLDVDPNGAEVIVNAGGIHIVKAWSEWQGPFLKTNSPAEPEWTPGTYGSINFPMVIEGVRHYCGSWMNQLVNEKKGDSVPLSIIYDRPVPLHLIGCSLWGGVSLGAKSQSTIIDQGTVFINKDTVGFTGEGITRYGRVVHIGTTNVKNGRILEPYIVDRRNTPGTAPPKKGVWQKGDGIINTDPDPKVPAKAWRGWVCIESGEPGKWVAYGGLGK